MRLILISILLLPQLALATLGGRPESVTNDERNLKATAHTVKTVGSYTVHELPGSINTVKEYVSSDGVVFAVTWRGMKAPDLSQLLGTYYSEYRAQKDSMPHQPGRQPVTIKTSNIVMIPGGHGRDLYGLAYVPALIPSGVNTSEVQP